MDPEIFARVVGGPSPEKSPDNILVLNLFYSGCQMFISKKLYFLKSPDRGWGSQISGGPTFSKVMGSNCIFFIETYRTRCFPGGSSIPAPSGFAHCICARSHVCGILKSPNTKHAVSSSKA